MLKQYPEHHVIEMKDQAKTLQKYAMDVMRALRESRSHYYSLSAEGRKLIALQERVIAHLHKWIYVEQVFNEDVGETQVSVIFTRSHDFMDAFIKAKKEAREIIESPKERNKLKLKLHDKTKMLTDTRNKK